MKSKSNNTEMIEEMDKIIYQLSQVLNNFSYGDQAQTFFEALTTRHRTLQQNFWRMIAKVAEMYADTEFDPRNEDSVTFCQKIKEMDFLFSSI